MRGTVLAAVLALSCGLLADTGVSPASASATAAAVTAPAPVVGLATPQAAMTAAQNQGTPVEVLGARSAMEQVWANPDGTWSTSSYSGPEFAEQPDGSWQHIDTNLERDPVSGDLVPRTAAADISLSSGAATSSAVETVATVAAAGDGASLTAGAASVTSAAGAADAPADEQAPAKAVSISVGWNGDLPVPIVQGNEATYPKAAPGQDLRVQAKPRGVEVLVDVHQPAALPDTGISVTLPLSAKGLTVREDGTGGYQLVDAAGQVVSDAPPATVWDAATDPVSAEPAHTVTVPTRVVRTATGWNLSVTVPKSFLDTPGLTWPVTVDPAQTIYASADTYAELGYNTTNFGSADDLKVGTYDSGTHVARSFLYFPVAVNSNIKVLSSTLKLYEWWSASCTAKAMNVKALTGSFSESAVTWNAQPAMGATIYGTITGALGHDSGCPAGFLGGSAGIPVTSLVTAWTAGTLTNRGLALQASETDSLGWKRFYSSEHASASARPMLYTTYNTYPGTPTTPTVVGMAAGWTNTTTPQMKATVTDGDGGTIYGLFNIVENGAQIYPASGSSKGSGVSSGTASVWTPPAGVLVNGHTYYFRAFGYDGSLTSAKYATSATFTVDSSAVGAPVISCGTALPLNQFTNPPPTSAVTCTATSSVGASGLKAMTVTYDGAAITGTLTGNVFSFTLSVAALTRGWHVLTAQGSNNAGSSSPLTKSGFGIGAAAITLPSDRDTTTRTIPLVVFAPAGVSARLQYLTDTGTWNDITTADQALTQLDGTAATQPVPLTSSGGAVATSTLRWDLSKTFQQDTVAQVRACILLVSTATCSNSSNLTGADANTSYAPAVNITLARLGISGASTRVGPLNITLGDGTGVYAITDFAAPGNGGVLSVDRAYNSSDSVSSGPFGPGWSTALPSVTGADWSRLVDYGTYALVYDSTGDPIGFTKTGASYTADDAGDGITLAFTNGSTGTAATFSLADNESTTVFTTATTGAQNATPTTPVTYSITSSSSTQGGTTTYTRDATGLTVTGPPPSGGSCPGGAGCTSLKLTLDGNGHATKLTWSGWAQSAAATPAQTAFTIDVACYSYDVGGYLVQTWDPREQATTPGACDPAVATQVTSYTYTGTRLSTITRPGEPTWTLGYDSQGRVSQASQSGLVTSISYGVATTATVSTDDTHPDLSPASIARWAPTGTAAPVTTVAVFGPADNVTDLRTADLVSLDAQGRTVFQSTYSGTGQDGWHTTTTVYDAAGHTVWMLSATNRERALHPSNYATDWSDMAVPAGTPSTTLADDLAAKSVYQDLVGDGVADMTDTFGPLHVYQASINGTLADVVGRSHVHVTYGTANLPVVPPTDATAMTTAPRHSALSRTTSGTTGADIAAPDQAGTARTVTNAYALPIAGGGYNTIGWSLGQVMQTTTSGPSTADVVTQDDYDTQGRLIEHRLPSAANQTSSIGSTRYTYYTAGNSPSACQSTVWLGQLCLAAPATGAAAQLPSTRYLYDQYLRVATKTESIGTGADRVTTTSYTHSGLGDRVESVTVSGGLGTAIPPTSFTYDAQGRLATTTSNGITTRTTYDSSGRIATIDDGRGGSTTNTYDTFGRPATVQVLNGASVLSTLTYGYGSGDPRGRLTSITDSTVGTIKATYDADGNLATQTLPDSADPTHPITETYLRDTDGSLSGLSYTQGANAWYADSVSRNAQGQVSTDTDGATKALATYGYDADARLIATDSTTAGACTSTRYSYDVNSDRTGSSVYPTAGDGSCQTTTVGGTQSVAFDAASRPSITGQQVDAWGRSTVTPAGYTSTRTDLTATYYVDDMLESSTSAGVTRSWTRDESARAGCVRTAPVGVSDPAACGAASVAGVSDEVMHYGSDGDQPVWTLSRSGGTTTTTRYLQGLDGQLIAIVVGTAVSYQLGNLHGDVVATSSPAATAAWDGVVVSSDAFGQASTIDAQGAGADNPRYGWLGGHQRAADAQAGMVLMGARVYNPATGLFLSQDPVDSSSNARYGYPADPVNNYDLDGRFSMDGGGDIMDGEEICQFLRMAGMVPRMCQYRTVERVFDRWKTSNEIGREGEAIGYEIVRAWLHRIHASRANLRRHARTYEYIPQWRKVALRIYDLYARVRGWNHWFEVKANGARLSDRQKIIDPYVAARDSTTVHYLRVYVDTAKYRYEEVCWNCFDSPSQIA